MDSQRMEQLLQEMDRQREAYVESSLKIQRLLAQNLSANTSTNTLSPPSPPPPSPRGEVRFQSSHRRPQSRAESDTDKALRKTSTDPRTFTTSSDSRETGENSDDEGGDESLYVSTPLEPESYDLEGLRHHLRSHNWSADGRRILHGVVDNPQRLSQQPLIPDKRMSLADRGDLAHYQVFDVGPDGSLLPLDHKGVDAQMGRPMAIWKALSSINPPEKRRQAVGRITVLREPSPILFGALHYTFSKHYDVDELFTDLVRSEASSASVHRAFDGDERRQRSCVFNFEYFTLIETGCQPMQWQLAANQEDRKPGHIALTRCSSVVALVLNGPEIRKVKNPARRAKNDRGSVYDPFSNWQVLNVQCFPDLESTLSVHDSTKHYVNGPEAFMTTVLGEFRDALERFDSISRKISQLVRPPLEFIFDKTIRDNLLFEDDEYTMARRYFWAHQVLAILNERIRSMIDAFETNFPAEVWEGTHKTLWPLLDETSPRNIYYKRKMASLKEQFESEMASLRKLIKENDDRRREIMNLKDDLFTGTSIQESRKSVTATETTVQQGHNIKLLTLVNIFFLPLSFVTSVFGMESLPPIDNFFHEFAITLVTVCVPFFLLVGSLNTHRGAAFWRQRWHATWNLIAVCLAWFENLGRKRPPSPLALTRTKSYESGNTRVDGGRVRPLGPVGTGVEVMAGRFRRRPTGWTFGESGGGGLATPGNVELGLADERGKVQREEANGGGVPLDPASRGGAAEEETVPSARQAFVDPLPRAPDSRIASLWDVERRRRLRYSEDV